MKYRLFKICSVAFAILISLNSTASRAQQLETLSDDFVKAIDQAMLDEMRVQQIVGMAAGLIINNKIVYLNGYGFADRENEVPITRDTMFRWASISKPLAAVAALQLRDQGKLNLTDNVRAHAPEFPDKGRTITVRDLICHQSGIVHYTNGQVIRTDRKYDTEHPFESVITALDTFKESPLIANPGEKFSYSTHAYILLSAVIERAGRQKYADQIDERICTPLELETLQPDYQWLDIPNRTKGYRRISGVIIESTNTDVSWKLGGGGFISNVDDLAKFALGLLQGSLVSKDGASLMATPQLNGSGEATQVGLGLFVEGEGANLKLAHNGSQEKTKTRMVFYPGRGIGAVIMCNTAHADPKKISTRLFAAYEEATVGQ